MKKSIIILCLLMLLPMAVLAQNKTVFQGAPGSFYLIDENFKLIEGTIEPYDNCEGKYYDASNITPRYFSFMFKLTKKGTNGGRAVGIDNKCRVDKITVHGKDCYRFYETRGDGSKHIYIFTDTLNKVGYLDIIWLRSENGGDYTPYADFCLWTDPEPVFRVLDWVYNNRIVPHK